MLLTIPILLCSALGPPLNSKDAVGTTFETSSPLPLQAESENHTTARENTFLIDGQTLSNCQKDLKFFNSTLDSVYPDQWPENLVNSFCAYNGSINNLSHFSQIKMPNKTSEELAKEPKGAHAIELGREPHFSLVTYRPLDKFREQNPPMTLEETTDYITKRYLENHTEIPTSKQKNSLTESSLTLGQITSSTILDDDLFPTFICQDRCGKKISFPCSCSATCVIYGTCCDNLAQDCPHVWEEGLTRFNLIRTADFICDQNSIYTIISCPIVEQNEIEPETSKKQMSMEEKESLQTRNRFLSNIHTTGQRQHEVGDNTTGVVGSEKNREDSITSRLLKALSAAPVTDSDTGLTFINKTVYNCNKMSESKALYWAVLFNYTHTSPTKLEDFVQHQMLNKYIPNFNKEILTDHICLRNLQQTCNQAADIEEPSRRYVKKCLESNNAVVTSLKTPFYYRNIFCAYCIEGRNNKYRLHLSNNVPKSSSPFQVLMTLTEDAFSLKKVNHGFEITRIPWTQAKCPIHIHSSVEQVLDGAKSDHDSQIQCSVTCGDSNFSLRSDGMCKAPHGVLLAIADDGLAPLCPEAMAGLAQFLACGLKQEIENLRSADFSTPSVSVVFDSSLNRSLYVVRLHLALPQKASGIFLYQKDVTKQNVYSVALLAKSFHHYRKSLKVCPPREDDQKDAGLKVFASSSLIKFGLEWKANIPQVMEELRGRIVDNQNITTLCLTRTVYCHKECPTKILNPSHLFCMDDPVHERDSAWIRKFRSSSCFYHLNQRKTKAKNRATSLTQGYESLQQLSGPSLGQGVRGGARARDKGVTINFANQCPFDEVKDPLVEGYKIRIY
ncbi:hypothetical protein PoB_004301100 [Plakobranchus ocellatus]|uniref:SMB domain-containing protein n=1 Tax=Plakobranchus ocellatus TaxID=259542 RepID=A0AAV4B7T3_9GAST|nr:hypothetical protein PoB_004301100 [Plakobranchus ocellatus]